jgi:hypothetical protein
MAFLTALEQSGRPLDIETLTYLTGAYLSVSDRVPNACWYPCFRRAGMDGLHPDVGSPFYGGARTAVRVV